MMIQSLSILNLRYYREETRIVELIEIQIIVSLYSSLSMVYNTQNDNGKYTSDA